MTNTLSKRSSLGFTIVELLIVVVIIAILAAITIVSYNGIVNSAKESSAQTELSQARNKVMLASAQTGSLPDSLVGAGIQNSSIEYNVSSDKLNYCLKYLVDSISYFTSTSESPNKGTCHGATGIRLGCIDKPSSCGYPDETNTGVIPGTTLRSVPSEVSSGPGWNYRSDINLIQTTADNAVISNINLDGGFIAVNHNNVTIRN